MKLVINFKSSITLFFLTSIVLIATSIIVEARPLNSASPQSRLAVECGGNQANTNFELEDSENRPAMTRPGADGCEMAPFNQKVTFYRLDMCTAEPTGPTTTAVADISNCQTFYRNDAGDDAVIENGRGNIVGNFDNFSPLDPGTYTHAVVTLGSVLKYTQTANFDGVMTVNNVIGSSTRCVTQAPTVTDASGGPSNVLYGNENRIENNSSSNIVCSDTLVAEETQIGVNTISRGDNESCIHALTFQATNSVIDTYLAETDGTLHDGVSNDVIADGLNGCQAGRADGITRVVGVLYLGNPIKVNGGTYALQMSFNNTRGLMLDMNNGSFQANRFDTAFFDFDLQALN